MDTRRLMLFSVLCFSLYMLWDAWQKYQNPPPPPVQASTVVEQGVPTPSGNLRAGVTELGQIGETAPASEKEERIAITTDLFKAQISTLGGSLVWTELSSFN
ncbi:MAG: membrane protein insertase YidC, partial [Azovibrio sp.]